MKDPASNFANAYTGFFQQALEYWTDAAQRELTVVIAAKALMLELELGDPDSKAAHRVQELLGEDYGAAARKLGVADAPRASAT